MSLTKDVADYITNVLELGTVYRGKEPADHTASLLVTLYRTGGTPTENWAGYEDPTIQVRATAVSYDEGESKLIEIRDALTALRTAEYNGWHYTGFWLISDVAHIGNDDRNRAIFTVNFRLMREPLES